jgi:hypothetical protein
MGVIISTIVCTSTTPSIPSWDTPLQQAMLSANDPASTDYLGYSVAISSDGNTAIVGAYNKNGAAGAAYIFIKSGIIWSQQSKLVASDAAGSDQFGYSVAISGDGNTVIVGAPYEDTSRTNNGAAYVFTRSGSTWSQEDKLLASDRQNDDIFGWSVAISDDGNTSIIGAYFEDTNPYTENGAAYVFTRSGSSWSQQAKLLASDRESSDYFGYSVSISDDGNTASISAYREDTSPNTDNGAAYIFTRSGSTWSQQAKLLTSDKADGDQFGYSVSISSDGNTVIVGVAFEDTSPNNNQGAAYIFTRSGSVWTEQAKLLASDRANTDYFGWSVDINSNGYVAIIGAYNKNSSTGAAYIFTRSGSVWTEQAKLLASGGASTDRFGYSVSINGDGSAAIAGAYQKDTLSYNNNGVAYIFTG